jgi:hypothetical protein
MVDATARGTHSLISFLSPTQVLSALSVTVTLTAGGFGIHCIDGRTERAKKGALALWPQWLAGTTYPRCATLSMLLSSMAGQQHSCFYPMSGILRSTSAFPDVQAPFLRAASNGCDVIFWNVQVLLVLCMPVKCPSPCRECGPHQGGGTRIPSIGEGTQPSQSSAQ